MNIIDRQMGVLGASQSDQYKEEDLDIQELDGESNDIF